MVSKLTLKPFRDNRQMLGRMIAIGLVIVIALALVTGSFHAEASMRETRKSGFGEANFCSAEIHLANATDLTVQRLENLEGVARVEPRLILDGLIKGKIGTRPIKIVGVQEGGPVMNTYFLLEGSPDISGSKVLVVGEKTDYKIEDLLEPFIAGSQYEFVISGFVRSIEFAGLPPTPNSTLPIPGDTLVVFTSLSSLQKISSVDYNNILVRYEEGVDKDYMGDRLAQATQEEGLQRITQREDEFTYNFLAAGIQKMQDLVPWIYSIFALIGGVLITVIVSKVVLDQQKEFGVMLALGYSRSEIIKGYLIFGLILGLITGAIGGLLGILFGQEIASAGLQMWVSINVVTKITAWPFLLSVVMGIGLITFSLAIPIYRISLMTPREAMRTQEAEETITNLGKKFGSITKLSLRNVVRRPKRLLALLAVLFFVVGMSGSFLMMSDSMTNYTDTWTEKQKWDIQATFSVPLSENEINQLLRNEIGLSIKDFEFYYLGYGRAGSEEIRVLGLEEKSEMNGFLEASGTVSYGSGKCVITRKLSTVLDKKVNSTISIKFQDKTTEFVIAGIVEDLREDTVFISIEKAQELFDANERSTGVYLQIDGQLKEAEESLYGEDRISYVTSSSDFKDAMAGLIGQSKGLFYMFSLAMLSVLVVAMITVALIDVKERESEHALLETLGYKKRISYKIIIQEIIVIGILSTLIGLPTGYGLALIWRDIFSRFFIYFPVIVNYLTFGIIAFFSIVFFLLSTLFPVRIIQKSKLVEVLRARMIG